MMAAAVAPGSSPPAATCLRVSIDPAFAERAVWRAIRGRDDGRGLLGAHRRSAEAAYLIADPAERDRAFGRAARGQFEMLGLAAPLVSAVLEHSDLAGTVELLVIGEARGRADEGITCEPGAAHLGVRLEAARFDEPSALLAWSRHALGHARDTLDADFHFERDWQEPGRVSAAAQARLHRLWDISVDARLVADGRLVEGPTRARHLVALAADLRGVGPATVQAALDWLWTGPRPSFPELMALAGRPVDLVRLAAPREPSPLQADRCPLCRFPALDVGTPAPEIAVMVRAEYPSWHPDDGLCSRCADRYRFMSRPGGGRWAR